VLQIEAFSVSPFVLGFLYVFTEIRVKRAPLRFRDVRSRILPRRWNGDCGRITDIALALSEAEYLIEYRSLVPQRRDRWCFLCVIDAPLEVFS
jgi:hypothetical protein